MKRLLASLLLSYVLLVIPNIAFANLQVYAGGDLTTPLLIYSNDQLNVYIDDNTIKKATSNNFYKETGNFEARLYFTYNDESVRQKAIETIKDINKNSNAYGQYINPDADQNDLTYLVVDVFYNKTFKQTIVNGIYSPKIINANTVTITKYIYNAPMHDNGFDEIAADNYNLNNKSLIAIYSANEKFQLDPKKTPLFYNIVQNIINKINSNL
ncbi:hypothetical protein Ga0466249_004327 [Sporomusaceae bacterium BoRhaA]|uniref:hypothetical protein n=1 Tax=Pelorhabdus rhamnosifermentans TaxID=2772457 RepID=UPI001C061E9B|nr:hypothetical protein [Pelorhabdus rhamnosifermentans]MBU2703191.1 hypothetical protein [Pelorhabdus rhamnosifermentans]